MKLHRLLLLSAMLGSLLLGGIRTQGEEAKMNALQTALSSTTINGYVDTSIEWTPSSNAQPQTATLTIHTRSKRTLWRAILEWLQANTPWHR